MRRRLDHQFGSFYTYASISSAPRNVFFERHMNMMTEAAIEVGPCGRVHATRALTRAFDPSMVDGTGTHVLVCKRSREAL